MQRSEYSRRSGERSSSHRAVTSTRNSLPDRREAHSSSRHVSSTHSSSRSAAERSRERSRDRSRHSYGASSRSLGGGASWSVGGSSSTYVGSSRDYDGDAWISGISASQGHGSHGLGNNNWSSSRDDHWSGGGGMADAHSHVSTYDKYDKYDSYDKYNRRY
ncbi:unnamed protein product [Onchocerca flexuosa]|uniref:SWFGD domain-containing protein n=1 Tax=Onchocerca flexuosa TaxID=387005 RepID=A0A183I4N4_9BILA|nr:unnamed protein product [Onchocerca flexuosa]